MGNRRGRAHARLSTFAAIAAMLAVPQVALARFGDATLLTGSQGHDVRVLQSWLGKLGFSTDVDGVFGRHTRWALRRFEQANNLQINGIHSNPDYLGGRCFADFIPTRDPSIGTGLTSETPKASRSARRC